MTSSSLPKKVMVDTSFLIYLVNPSNENHANAWAYFLMLKNSGATFYISTLVISEYNFNGNIDVVIDALQARVLAYGFREAVAYPLKALEFNWIYKKSETDKRALVTDLMLVVQAETHKLDAIITGDKKMGINFLQKGPIKYIDCTLLPEEITPLWEQARASVDTENPVVKITRQDDSDISLN